MDKRWTGGGQRWTKGGGDKLILKKELFDVVAGSFVNKKSIFEFLNLERHNYLSKCKIMFKIG